MNALNKPLAELVVWKYSKYLDEEQYLDSGKVF
jgi:hypothetical protein